MSKICKISICDRASKSNGYCNTHGERLRKTGSVNENVPIQSREKRNPICLVKNCRRKHKSKGYCGAHSKRLRDWGELREEIPLRDYLSVGCMVENCDFPKKAFNLCNKHYEKLKKYGNPLAGKEANKGYVGKRYIDKYGYAFVYVPVENKRSKCMYVSEHRLVMEQKLGRKLLPQETVHHLNGDRQDNRPENLEIWLYPQKPGQRVKDLIKWAKQILATYGDDEEKV